MTAITNDILVQRFGAEGVYEDYSCGLGSSVTVYSGTIALADASTGYLKSPDSPAATDTVLGITGDPAGGTYVKTGPGIVNGTTAGAVVATVLRGSFLLLTGTGSDALTEANVGDSVYMIDGQTVGATSGSATRPIAGVMLPLDPTIPSGYVPIKMVNPGS